MTPDQRAKLEQVARECVGLELRGTKYAVILRYPGTRTYEYESESEAVVEREWWVEWLMDKLASRDVVVLEEVAEKIGRRIDWYSNTVGVDQLTRRIQINEAQGCIELLRQQAQERRA